MRRLREIMAEPGDGQSRLDRIVVQIAGIMVAEVCSIYLRRQDGSLELFATEGLNREAVHSTRMKRGEGLVGRCAEFGVPVNEPDAQHHPAFSFRPETGEEIYHSLLAVPILRGGVALGVLVVQNKTKREYSDEDVEVLQTTAMVIAEHLGSGAVAGSGIGIDTDRSVATMIKGEPFSDGIALGHIVLHEPRVVVTELLTKDPEGEIVRLDKAIEELRSGLDDMLAHEGLAKTGEHRDVLETYRMFANDRGWTRRMRDAISEGLTAEAAVERVQNAQRARMLRQNDPYWRERLRDLDDLSDRLLRILVGRSNVGLDHEGLPNDTILVARTMGPAELLDYDRSRLRGLVIEDGSGQSHVAIVAKALGIAAIGQAPRVIESVSTGDPAIVDAQSGELHIRPTADVIAAYSDKVRFQARRQSQYRQLRTRPAITKDGTQIGMHINAGLLVDMPNLRDSGGDGIGLFRTELQFMIASAFPRLDRQTQFYSQVLSEAGERPVVFRSLDIGGDKSLPYLKQPHEENPALGWRGIRLTLDRPALLRTQFRALLRSATDRDLNVMIPMVTTVAEFDAARQLFEREREHVRQHGRVEPSSVRIGAMIEVPSLLFELDALLDRVDFVSIGSNDLLQYLYAADRGNARVSSRYDTLSHASLRALKSIADACRKRNVAATVCGEMAGRPLEAMALLGVGYRSISMAPAAIGAVKAMILSLDLGRLTEFLADGLDRGDTGSLREALLRFAEGDSIEL
jgi:phosphotransferase system enzyme I (PtsP)